MGQKDLAAKELESKPDVFADIINAFVYDGEPVVLPGHLKPAPTETVYERTHKMLHNQYNDVSKHEMAGQKIRMQYIDNIKLHLFSMAHLPQDIRKRFKSDLRIIVDYLAEGNDYEPTNQKIKYVEPVMRLLYALTGEWEFISSIGELTEKQEKGDDVTMCEVVDKFVARGLQQGIEQGIQQGIQQGLRVNCTL